MRVIWKYPLKIDQYQAIKMPSGAELLTVQMNNGSPCLWAMVDKASNFKDFRQIVMQGTGHEIYDGTELKYLGTVQIESEGLGILVWHYFEEII